MAYSKRLGNSIGRKGSVPGLTPRTFVRAASLSNVLVVGAALVACVGTALTYRHTGFFLLTLLVFSASLTLLVWSTAGVLCVAALGPLWIRRGVRRLIGRGRSKSSGGLGVWDDWLDSPALRKP
jgi:hypothetical protein